MAFAWKASGLTYVQTEIDPESDLQLGGVDFKSSFD
jgi:hypothetical protein